MKNSYCESLQASLTSDEALSAEQSRHLDSCAACRELAEAHGLLRNMGQRLRQAEDSNADSGARLMAAVRRHAEARPTRSLRLVWTAMAAGLVCLVAAGAFLMFSGQPDVAQDGERFFTLMDDVDAIATGDGEDEVVLGGLLLSEGQDGLAAWMDEDMETDLDACLPTGYQALQDVLEDRWL